MQEVNLPFDDGDELDEVVESIMADVSAETHPHLVELTMQYVLQPGYSYGNEFAYGLDLILAGLAGAASTAS